ncbi:MAG: ATP-binding protein [Mucinivorans sp.]
MKRGSTYKATMFMLALIFCCLHHSPSFADTTHQTAISKSDYVLIINTYTESSDWSNSFIHPIYESLLRGNSNLTVYAEHMSMLLINTQQELDEYRAELFEKYSTKRPRAIMILGNPAWEALRKDLETRWPNVPVILCVEKPYNGPIEAYINKQAIPEQEQTPLADYNGPLHLTIIYDAIYLQQTIDLMRQMIPGMNRILFLSDKRYVSAQVLDDLTKLLKNDYPNIEMENITPDDVSVNQMFDKLRNVPANTGILYFSWYKKNSLSKSTFITTNDYKMFSRYTDAPIFTLTDKSVGGVEMAGGYFVDNKRIRKIIISALDKVLSGANHAKITIENCGDPAPVLNYQALTEKGVPIELCPEDTIFYMKELTVFEKYTEWIILGLVLIFSGFGFLLLKMNMLNKIRNKQKEKLLLIQDYSSLFANMPVAYVKKQLIYNKEGVIVDYLVTNVNPCFEKYFVMAGDSPVGTHGTTSPSFKEFVALYKLAINDKKEITAQYYHQQTGRYYSMVIAPSKIEGYLDIFYADNTELAMAQQMLGTLNHKLAIALDVADITPWRLDIEQSVIVCDINRETGAISSDPAEDHVVVNLYKYISEIHKDDQQRVNEAYDNLMNGKTSKIKEEYRVRSRSRNGQKYDWVEIQAIIDKRDANGKPISLIGSSLVISNRKKMENDLVDAKNHAEESNRLKSAFLANMSHEIRTPLNAIVGFSEILASTESEDEKREYVSIIEDNNTLLLQLISDILDLSKIEAGTLEFNYFNVDIRELFTELETSFRLRITNSNVEIINEGITDCCILTDKNRLIQVITNMVNNAAKFTSQGSIRFGYSVQEDGNIYFYVKDTGCGIAPDKIDSIFGRFVKLNNFVQGTGLGLSICQTIVNRMGGEIGVESKVDQGTTFWFTIPYTPISIQPKADEQNIVPQIVEKDKLTVLVAEDNASNFKLFEAILKKDYHIYHAWDGQQAIEMFKEYNPHIILMDINMPKINGYEAITEIRKISASIPIIAVTAYAFTSDEQRIKESGFDDYTAKPVNSQILKSKMMVLLKRRMIFM